MRIGNREFKNTGHCYVCGILNVTPDSFSDGGKWNGIDAALRHAEEMVRDGADIIDVGGESTRPGYTFVSVEEEVSRIAPVIEAIKARIDIPISLDTYKAGVAEEGIKAGADLINDIWGLKYEPAMAELIARTGVACVLMHNRDNTDYPNGDLIAGVRSDLEETLRIARAVGIRDERIVLDPGIGFGKTYEQNLYMLKNLEMMNEFGYPVLLGTSRKSVIGLTLDLPAAQRVEGTLVTTILGLEKGVSFVRVHDVKENVRAIRMAEAIRTASL